MLAACIRGLMSGLATHTNHVIQEPLVVRDKDRRPPRGPLAVQCFCVIQEPLVVRRKDRRPQQDPWRCTASACSDIVLFGDLKVNRTMERDLLFIYTVDLSKDVLDLLGISY